MFTKFIGTEKEIKGVASVNANQTVDMGLAIDQAFYTEGEIYVYHPDLATAEEKAKYLNDELEFELGDVIEGVKEGILTIARLLDEGYADDVVAFVKEAVKPSAPKETVSEAEILAGLKEAGLEIGMVLPFPEGGSATIKRFKATSEGVFATLDVAGKEHTLHVVKLLEIKNTPVTEGEKPMKKVNFVQAAQNQQEGEGTNQNTATEMEMEEMTQAEKIAKGTAAQKLLQQAQQKAAQQAAQKAAEQKRKEEEAKMNQAPTANQSTGNKEGATNMEKRQGTVVGKMGASNTETKGARPSRRLGTVDNRRAVKGASKEVMASIFDKPVEKETATNPYKGLPWFFNEEIYANVLREEILETRKNEALGITDISIYAPEDVMDNPGDELAYIGVEIGHSIQLRFKIKEHTNPESATPITTTNIKWFETRRGQLYPDYVFYRKNEQQITVKCTCGKWNDIKELGKLQECACGHPVGMFVEARVFGGEDVSSNYVAQRLPFGTSIDRSVLAQVMMFAHLKLAPLFQ